MELLLYSNCVARDALDLVLVLHLGRCSTCLILLSFNLEMLRSIRGLLTNIILHVDLVTSGSVALVAILFALVNEDLMRSRTRGNCIRTLGSVLSRLV